MNQYYYDLNDKDLKKYYNSLNLSFSTPQHIAEVEKEMEKRNI